MARGSSATTAPIDSASLNAGMMTATEALVAFGPD
jgi:hypothetical protein